jgi:hypothetical protein
VLMFETLPINVDILFYYINFQPTEKEIATSQLDLIQT